MANKRNFVRYNMDAKVSFKTKEDISKIIQGRVLDISTLGWSASFSQGIDINTIIQFDLTANFLDKHLTGLSKIVNVTQEKTSADTNFRIGVEFIEVDKELVLRFISENRRIIEAQKRKPELDIKKQWVSEDVGPF